MWCVSSASLGVPQYNYRGLFSWPPPQLYLLGMRLGLAMVRWLTGYHDTGCGAVRQVLCGQSL